MKDTTQAILRRAGVFFSGTALSRVTGMIRDILLAWAFGATSSLAAFMVAFRFAHLLRRILGEGAMQSAFIPQLVVANHQSEERAKKFFSNLSTILTYLLILIVVLGEVTFAALVHFDVFSPEGTEVCQLSMLMLPGLLFICLYGINASLLQCEGYYWLSSAAPLAFNAVWIVGILGLSGWAPYEAMPWLAGIVTIACFGQWMITVPKVRRLLGQGIVPSLSNINFTSPDLRALGKALSLGLLGVSASQIASALDGIFAQYANSRGPAYLWYAIRIQQLPLSLLALALSGALLPALSRSIKKGDLAQGRNLLNYALRQNLLLVVPCMFGLLATGGTIVNMLFGRGDFTSVDTIATTTCLWAYALGLVPLTLVLLLAPGFYALGDYKTPTRGTVLTVTVNIALNYLAVAYLEWGPASVALMGSLCAWCNVCWLHVHLQRRLGTYVNRQIFWDVSRTLLASLIALGVTMFLPSTLPRDVVGQISACAMACGTFGIIWLLIAWLTGLKLEHAEHTLIAEL